MNGSVLRRLLGFLRPLAGMMAVSVACRVINQALGVAIPVLGVVAVMRAMDGKWGLVWLMAGLAVGKGLFRYLEQFTGHHVAFRLLSLLRSALYEGLVPLLPSPHLRSGELMSSLTSDVERIEPFYAHTIAPLVSAVAIPAAGVGVLVAIHPRLGLTAALPVVVGWLVPFVSGGSASRSAEKVREASARVAGDLAESVQGLRDVVVMGAEGLRESRLRIAGARLAELRAGLAAGAATRAALGDVAAGIGLVAVAVVGFGLLEAGAVSPEGYVASVGLVFGMFGPVRAVEALVPDLTEALAAARRLFSVIDRPPAVSDPEVPRPLPLRFDIEVEDVVFGYRPGLEVLDGVSFRVEEGERVAIVGASGSGKSTLAGLLLGWWTPDRGAIRVGGTDLADLALEDRRRLLAVVEQPPHLVWGTVADNLRLASDEASLDEMAELLEELGVELGPDTRVGELGRGVSGGQRQRIAIARALLREAPILVLDEATSELDVDSEQRVLDVVLRRAEGRTVLMAAHRLSTVRRLDRVVVLDRGRVVEEGTFEELVAAGGTFAGLVARERDLLA